MPDEFNGLELWDSVEETKDPTMVKWASVRGGFASVDAYYRIKLATELWGPYGRDWGLRECRWEMVPGGDNGAPSGIVLMAKFEYPDGKFPIAVDDQYRPTADVYKKLTTGAITKALSYLGFCADVFMGEFVDEKSLKSAQQAFDAETRHANTVQTLVQMLNEAIGCRSEPERMSVLRWAGVTEFGSVDAICETEGAPTEALNAIRAKAREEKVVKWPSILEIVESRD